MNATRRVRLALLLALALAALSTPAAAEGAINSVFGGDVSCSVQNNGVRFCGSSSPRSTTKTFDGVPLDVNVAFPPAPASGADGNYPLVMLFHGYGGGKIGLAPMQPWLDRGYATFSMTTRGFRESCGSSASRSADPAGCAAGYIRLMDTRYEVRDAQHLAGRLVDEGLVAPDELAAIGGSYGGALSLALAALKNRVMLPSGELARWTSPGGTAMEIAAAAPFITWSDLAYSLVPNGRTLDYVADAPYRGPFGVMKESLVNGLYLSGQAAPGFYAPPGSDPSADLTTWRQRLLAGEPYDDDPAAESILAEVTAHHSAYYIDDSTAPAPILFANGFTDDLFPADEALRFFNRTRTEHRRADISLIFGEIAGHPRSAGKQNVSDFLRDRQLEWFDHFVLGAGSKPFKGITAFTQTCPTTAPGGGPYQARNWARIAPGEIVGKSRKQTIAATSGDPSRAATIDPVTGGGSCAQVPAVEEPGTATVDLKPAPSGGYTLLGAPTVVTDFKTRGETSQVAARLLDVDPSGQATLVARGLWRPKRGNRTQVFQLHPNGWRFEQGHVARLELLAADDGNGALGGYGRRSNDQQNVKVSDLKLHLPVTDRPGSLRGRVIAREPAFVPKGYELAPGFKRHPAPGVKGKLRTDGKQVTARIQCPSYFAACRDVRVAVHRLAKGAKPRPDFFVAGTTIDRLNGGRAVELTMDMTRRARAHLRRRGRLAVSVAVSSAESRQLRLQNRKLTVGG